MSTAHTPGPWRVAPASLYVGSDINVDAGANGYIAMCGKLGDLTAEANARLIAAAPDLLAELQNIANANPLNWDAPHNDFATFHAWAQSRARAAIAKAVPA